MSRAARIYRKGQIVHLSDFTFAKSCKKLLKPIAIPQPVKSREFLMILSTSALGGIETDSSLDLYLQK